MFAVIAANGTAQQTVAKSIVVMLADWLHGGKRSGGRRTSAEEMRHKSHPPRFGATAIVRLIVCQPHGIAEAENVKRTA